MAPQPNSPAGFDPKPLLANAFEADGKLSLNPNPLFPALAALSPKPNPPPPGAVPNPAAEPALGPPAKPAAPLVAPPPNPPPPPKPKAAGSSFLGAPKGSAGLLANPGAAEDGAPIPELLMPSAGASIAENAASMR